MPDLECLEVKINFDENKRQQNKEKAYSNTRLIIDNRLKRFNLKQIILNAIKSKQCLK